MKYVDRHTASGNYFSNDSDECIEEYCETCGDSDSVLCEFYTVGEFKEWLTASQYCYSGFYTSDTEGKTWEEMDYEWKQDEEWYNEMVKEATESLEQLNKK